MPLSSAGLRGERNGEECSMTLAGGRLVGKGISLAVVESANTLHIDRSQAVLLPLSDWLV